MHMHCTHLFEDDNMTHPEKDTHFAQPDYKGVLL